MRIALAVCVLFLVQFSFFARYQDGDVVWLQWLGHRILKEHAIPTVVGRESFSAMGSAWVPHDWAFGVLTSWGSSVTGGPMAAGLVIVAAIAALLLVGLRAKRRGASSLPTGFAVLCTGFAMSGAFGVRAQVVAWPFLAAVLLLSEEEGPVALAAIPLVVFWANLHASAAIAPVILTASAVGAAISERSFTGRVRRKILIAAGTVVALFATPFFWRLPAYIIGAQLDLNHSHRYIAEWQRPGLGLEQIAFGTLPLAVALGYAIYVSRRIALSDALVAAVALVLGASAIRQTPLSALIIAPLVAQYLTQGLNNNTKVKRLELALCSIPALLILVIVSAAAGFSLRHTQSAQWLPRNAASALAAQPGKHRLFCEHFAWCSLGLGKADIQIFLDSRADPFPRKIWEDYGTIRRQAPGWGSTVQRYGINAMLVDTGGRLAAAMSTNASWHVAYGDSHAEVLVETTRFPR